MNLYEYFLAQRGRSMIKFAHYFAIYEQIFARFRNLPVLMFEIGTGYGGSAQMWKKYFGPMAKIVTIDIIDKSDIAESQIYPRRGHQADTAFLSTLIDEFGSPDIVFDDGSHQNSDIRTTFEYLFPKVSPNGVYLIEDLNTSYSAKFGGGYKHPGSFIEYTKDLIDQLNAVNANMGELKTEFSDTAYSISFFDMLISIEKRSYVNKEMMYLPPPPDSIEA